MYQQYIFGGVWLICSLTTGPALSNATDAPALGPAPPGAPRRGVWVDYSSYQMHLALENSVETPYKFHC